MKTKTIEGWVPDGESEQSVLAWIVKRLEFWGVPCCTKKECLEECCPNEKPRKTEITITVEHKD